MGHDEHQADLFDRLIRETGLIAKEIDLVTGCGLRQAYRLIAGSTPLTFSQTKQLIMQCFPRVGELLTDDLLAGTGRMVVLCHAEGRGDVDGAAVEVLQEVTNFLRRRHADRLDGAITPEERDREVELVDRAVRVLCALRDDVQTQPTVRHATAFVDQRNRACSRPD